jgi:hypothetical protein
VLTVLGVLVIAAFVLLFIAGALEIGGWAGWLLALGIVATLLYSAVVAHAATVPRLRDNAAVQLTLVDHLLASPHRRSTGPVGPGRGAPVADSMQTDGPAVSVPGGDPPYPWGKPWDVHYGPRGRIVSNNDVHTQTRNGVVSGSFTEGWRKIVYGPRHTREGSF